MLLLLYLSIVHSCAGMLPACIASLALAFSCVANFQCSTIQFPAENQIEDVYDATLHFGPWYQQSVQASDVNGT